MLLGGRHNGLTSRADPQQTRAIFRRQGSVSDTVMNEIKTQLEEQKQLLLSINSSVLSLVEDDKLDDIVGQLDRHALQVDERGTQLDEQTSQLEEHTDELETIKNAICGLNRSVSDIKGTVCESTVASLIDAGGSVATDHEELRRELEENIREELRKEFREKMATFGSSLRRKQLDQLEEWLGPDKTLRPVFRGTKEEWDEDAFFDIMENSTGPVVLLVRRNEYIFGCYIEAGIRAPEDGNDVHKYDTDVWFFSLAGHFDDPAARKIPIPKWRQQVVVARRGDESLGSALKVGHDYLCIGTRETWNEPDWIRSCQQAFPEKEFLCDDDEYQGETDYDDDVLLGGATVFEADEIEVLQVVPESVSE
ncbi:unnamed protein product [Vitrella brassicaformis CCMP3155]|uniref:TLDc domain-containing protein n=1 Tax=Vitrella brassicaformis (strain CCMP3155) TaxID=1169540 RepID=A0A0G4G3M6_VITBC|nr:unnamed protein product [Vitrella brassicaformis CCMP3155]|eukprot:CEM22863.1 unnamed protein product [Vitrella brassicaformis CCMP3155]